MKTPLLTTCLLLFALISFCQTNEWTWVSGDSTANNNGVYGMKGTAAPGNKPGSRWLSVSWTDHAGNLWLFGGYGNNASGFEDFLNDLWKYDITTNEWTWISGDSTINNYLDNSGLYGMKGIASAANQPGSRNSAVSWTDSAGYLWLFGGYGYAAAGNGLGYLNDLWKYDITNNQWTWISGDDTINTKGVFGTRGIASAANKPEARQSSASWADHSGNLWLLGGADYDPLGAYGDLNDLWKYSIVSNEWTWINGDSARNSTGIYGVKGITSPGNKPGARYYSVSCTDNSDNLWLFGGEEGYSSINSGVLNDLWKYSIGSNEWTWIGGDSTEGIYGVYGSKGAPATGNEPGSRFLSVCWNDNGGNFWLFGGFGEPASGYRDYLNDLWRYSPVSNQWTWISGDSTGSNTGAYFARGTASPVNMPGSREPDVSWTDISGNLWLFGGWGYGISGGISSLNDLWELSIGNSILPLAVKFSESLNTVCAGERITFTDSSTGSPTSWNWVFTGGTPDTSTAQNPTITYNAAGTYNVKLVVSNSGGTDSLTKTGYITVNPLPVPVASTADSLICSSDSTQVCTSNSFVSYSWNTTDTTRCTTVKQAGNYYVTVTDANGCTAVSNHREISVYPVPSVSITVQGDTLSSFGAASYQWHFNNNPISDATSSVYIAHETGEYAVEVTDTNGCSALSNNTQVVIMGINNLGEGENISLYPNPSAGSWQLAVDISLVGSNFEVYDDNGRIVFQSKISNPKSAIDLDVARGVYWLKIVSPNINVVKRLIKL